MVTTRYAFFDVDETLIRIKSMFSFRDFYLYWVLGPEKGLIAKKKMQDSVQAQVAQGLSRTEVNRLFWETFRGYKQTDVQKAVIVWHRQIRMQPGYFIESTLNALQQHQREGVEPIFVSGSCTEILEPLATELNVKILLANHLEVAQGKFTGKLLSPQTIGEGKRQAICDFLEKSEAQACDCYGYGDHLSDIHLLEAIGHPRVVEGNSDLMSIAHQRGWPVLSLQAHA